MIERRVPEPLLALSDAPAREESSHDSEDEDETPEEIEFDMVDRSEPRGGKLAVFLLVVAIGGGVWFFAKTRRVPPVPPSDTAAPGAPASATGPSGTTAPSGAVLSVPSPAPAEASAAPSVPPPPAIPESRGSTMLSPDWNGAPAWVIHFSSFQRRENAERDAARLAKALGRPLRVVSVNLGKPGLWYRVMLGEYGSREEALAAREALVGKGVSGVGLVYRVEAAATSSSAPAP
jgi:hypothetical protein